MSTRVVVYIAGPFSAPTREGVEANIRAAGEVALEVAKLGCTPLCPHLNTSLPEFDSLQPYQFWIEATLELLKRCDAIVMVPGWEQSSGARGEWEWACENGMPGFVSVELLAAAMRTGLDFPERGLRGAQERSEYKRGMRAGLEAVRDRVDELLRETG